MESKTKEAIAMATILEQYGRLDEDLKQYILIHIALNISKFKI